MNSVKLGIIGTNFVSDWLCDAVEHTDGICCHAVYSRTAESGKAFAAKHGIQNVYTDMEKFLSSDIDAVYIASPNFLHRPQAIAAMNHGKHVLVEKPAALSAAEFEEMAACARRNGVVLLEAMRPAHDEALGVVRQQMKKMGPLRRAVLEFCKYSTRYDHFRAGEILNAFNPALGNAAVMDIGVYAISVCVLLFGAPKSIVSRSVVLQNGFEGMGTALLDYGTLQAEIVYSKIHESVNPSVISGEDGSLKIGGISTLAPLIYCPRKGEEENLFPERKTDGSGNMIYEVADFVQMIAGQMQVDPYTETTLETLRIIDEIRRQNAIIFPDTDE